MSVELNGSTDYLYRNSAVLSAVPCAMLCWFRPTATALTVTGNLVALGSSTDNNPLCRVYFEGTAANDPVISHYRNASGTSGSASYGGSPSASTWYLASGGFFSTAKRVSYLGTSNASDTTSVTGTLSLDRTAVGQLLRASPTASQYFSGRIAEAAIWDLTSWGADATARQTAWEAALVDFAAGKAPSFYTTGLVGYWPLISDATDSSGNGNNLSTAGSPTYQAHPSITYPSSGNRRRRVLIGGGVL